MNSIRVVISLLVVLFIGCDEPPNSASTKSPLYLVASGDTAGWIVPCGCAANQSGGLQRRGTYLSGLRQRGTVLYIDVGGAAAGDSDYQKVKFESIVAGEKLLQIGVHNLGRSEIAMGVAYLRDLAGRSGVKFISANAIDAASGQPIVDTHHLVTVAGRELALVGVVSPRYATDAIRVTDARQAVSATIGSLKGRYQSLIVLAYLDDTEIEQLAAALPEADVVLGGPTGQAMTPRKIGPTLLAAATNKGKFLVQLEHDGTTGWRGSVVEMGTKFADDAQQTTNLQAYLAELERSDFTATQSGLAPSLPSDPPVTYRLAGSASCLSCHRADHDGWLHSKHAHAWDPLEQKKFHVDPSCMQCHTTGFGMPGGFVSRTASVSMMGVGCESCHGPSQEHVQRPSVRTAFSAADQCIHCHDQENSPTFVYKTYWAKIKHGQTDPRARREATP